MSKHTQGPWRFIAPDEFNCRPIVQRGSQGGFQIYGLDRETEIADAQLIAAAPDLLEANEPERGGPDFLDWIADRFINIYGENENTDFIICLRRRAQKSRAAIAKATA